MDFTTSDGLSVSYDDIAPEGYERAILLVHGFASNRNEGWKRTGWYAALERRRFRVIALDQRGHGQSGKGDGGMIDILRTAPTDLTTLSRNNGGVFPFEHVYAVIDGRQAVKGHGSRDMPIWGKAYSAETVRAGEHYVDMPYNMEMYVRARILSLIDYLSRIQAR